MLPGFPAASIFHSTRRLMRRIFAHLTNKKLTFLVNRILLYFGPFSKPKNILKSPKNQAFTGN
jgi:hypothetical protein